MKENNIQIFLGKIAPVKNCSKNRIVSQQKRLNIMELDNYYIFIHRSVYINVFFTRLALTVENPANSLIYHDFTTFVKVQ